jgi:magnesium-transporting ATPase (P-type)
VPANFYGSPDRLVGIVDPPRPGVQYSVQVLKKSGVHICMITGDAKETATAIANSIGIYNPERDQTLSGAQLESMSEVCWFRGKETVHDVFLSCPMYVG